MYMGVGSRGTGGRSPLIFPSNMFNDQYVFYIVIKEICTQKVHFW